MEQWGTKTHRDWCSERLSLVSQPKRQICEAVDSYSTQEGTPGCEMKVGGHSQHGVTQGDDREVLRGTGKCGRLSKAGLRGAA